MNKLKPEKQVQAISMLTEGCSVRSTERLTGIHRDTILRLMVRVGTACAKMMDEKMQDLPCKTIQVDEQWTFVGKKQRHLNRDDDQARVGDFWLWAAICADTRAVPTIHIGKRTSKDAHAFMQDLQGRLRNRVQLSSDGLALYVDAVESAFGGAVDYGQIVKSFETEPTGAGRYSPPRVSGIQKKVIVGMPNEGDISTSYMERLNLTTRMRCRRLTRLVDSFSKKPENLKAALELHFASYNFVKRHKSLDGATPAMALGVTDRLWGMSDLVALAGW